jgi:hypothetical protein
MRRTVKRRFGQIDNVRVIRDIRNSNKDYWISAERAKQLYDENKLTQIEAYAGKWCYATKDTNEYYD